MKERDRIPRGFYPVSGGCFRASECERRDVWRDDRDGRNERDGMSAISRRSFMELEAGDNKG